MKIAYVLHHNILFESGVTKKVYNQIRYWTIKEDVRIFALTPMKPVSGSQKPDTETFPYHTDVERISAAIELVRNVYAWSPDLIYFRYNPPYPPLHLLFRKFPTVVELNSDDNRQFRRESFKRFIYNYATRGLVLRNATGFISTTYEIASLPNIVRYKKPTLVLGDGIDLSLYPQFPNPKNSTPRIIFIGTDNLIWHGIDKILWLADRSPNFYFDLVGIHSEHSMGAIPDNVRMHGFLQKEEYEELFRASDISIGTLALHRIGMNESSSLKVREYLAYGLPVILGYRDTDFLEPQPFLLQLPNSEDNVQANFERIHNFVNVMKGERVSRDIIESRIDSALKEKQRTQFMRSCLS